MRPMGTGRQAFADDRTLSQRTGKSPLPQGLIDLTAGACTWAGQAPTRYVPWNRTKVQTWMTRHLWLLPDVGWGNRLFQS